MSLGKVARKLKRVGKTACQFRFTSTFEYIDLDCEGSWRPDKLRVIWLRNHRRVQSIDVDWVPTEDRGPHGAEGRATFNPPIAVALIITLYRDSSGAEFEEKEYKYYIESDGPNGKKILASFNCDVAEYAGVPSTRHTLDMTFKTVSKKINKSVLGITLESEYLKQGSAMDDDMQSTFSAVSAGHDSLTFEEDEDEGEDGRKSFTPLDKVLEESEPASQFSQQDSQKGAAANSTPSSSSKNRVSIHSKETYKPPANPYLEDEIANGEDEELPPPSPTAAWLGDAMLIDCFGEPVGREKLDSAKIIGLYFSANWCPPCRRFLPKLVKFYHHLKQHGKSFEILYISSDYSKQEMTKYMQDQQMPWVGLAFDSSMADKLRTDFSVSAIPLFTVVTSSGAKIEESAKKSVEAATSSSSVLKLYNRWYENVEAGEGEGEKKGLLQRMKGAIKGNSRPEVEPEVELESKRGAGSGSHEVEPSGAVRHVVETKQLPKSRSKSHVNLEMYEQKEKQVHHLEEVNMSLKQTNDDLNEELAELRRQLSDARQKLEAMEQSSRQLEDEKRELLANLNIRGWLCKRGLKGPTANVWRRRFFRCDQGSKIYYYKSASEGTPQGFIDLDKVISVQEVSAAQQDKNHATFLVQCDGRTFQLQAHDEATMRKWMSAIEYLTDWRKRHTNGALP